MHVGAHRYISFVPKSKIGGEDPPAEYWLTEDHPRRLL